MKSKGSSEPRSRESTSAPETLKELVQRLKSSLSANPGLCASSIGSDRFFERYRKEARSLGSAKGHRGALESYWGWLQQQIPPPGVNPTNWARSHFGGAVVVDTLEPAEWVWETLQTVWSSPEFWKSVDLDNQRTASPLGGSPSFGTSHRALLEARYGIVPPELSAPIWMAMVSDSRNRNSLFHLLCIDPIACFSAPNSGPGFTEVRKLLGTSDETLRALFGKYCDFPEWDLRPDLVRLHLAEDAHDLIERAATKLSEDLAWLRKHPGQRLVAAVPKQTSGIRHPGELQNLEKMVELLRQDRTLSDYGLAKLCMGETTTSHRRLASQARSLAKSREKIALTPPRPRNR